MLVGVVGKPNVGKSTFFAASTLKDVQIADYPFTTIHPNVGIAHLRTKCVCKEMNVVDNPRNSVCVDGERLIPVGLVDVAGLVPGAAEGRGLGNKFLDELRQADALIHVVDASGSTDIEGKKVSPGSHDPLEDVEMVEEEFNLWVLGLLKKEWEKMARLADQEGKVSSHIADRLSGLSVTEADVDEALLRLHMKGEKAGAWTEEQLRGVVREISRITKPSVIVANKADLPTSAERVQRLKETGRLVIPCAAEAELLLRRAAEHGLVRYTSGDSGFIVQNPGTLTQAQRSALEMVASKVLKPYGDTGVQRAINEAYFGLLGSVVVFPVEDETKLTDKEGRVLPDALVLGRGSTALDLARAVHSDLADSFLYAVDARTGKRWGADHVLENRSIVKIVSSGKRN